MLWRAESNSESTQSRKAAETQSLPSFSSFASVKSQFRFPLALPLKVGVTVID